MKGKMLQRLESFTSELDTMTPEEIFEKYPNIFPKPPELDYIILDKIVKFIIKNECIDGEGILYFPKKYPIAEYEFQDCFEALDQIGERIDVTDRFPEYRRYFEYEGIKFIWNLMIGQGSAQDIMLPWEKVPFDETKKIKL